MIPIWIGAGLITLLVIIGAIAIGFSATMWLWIFLGIFLAWLGLLFRLWYKRLDVKYRVTTQRLFHEKGILRRATDRVEIIDIDDVRFEQGLVDRFTGVGKIRITSSDRTDPELVMFGIENAKEVADKIDKARRKERVRRGLHIETV